MPEVQENSSAYPLGKVIEVMKPCKVDLSKTSHQKKLELAYESPSYVAERKIDGCHYVCIGGRFFSTQVSKKTGLPRELTDNVPHLVEGFMSADLGQAILDGEIFYPDDHKSYGATKITGCGASEAVRRQKEEMGWISYMIFDILRAPDGKWLLGEPWRYRREILEQLIPQIHDNSEYLQVISVKRSRKKQFLKKVLEEGGEGIVLKNILGTYQMGKRPMWNWIKLKVEETDDVVIMGYEPPEKRYTGKNIESWPYWEGDIPVSKNYYMGWIGSIRFGKYDGDNNLIELGSCTGMTESDRREFSENGDKYIGTVMEIKAMEKTEDGKYRHPNFVRLHPDKNPEECVTKEG